MGVLSGSYERAGHPEDDCRSWRQIPCRRRQDYELERCATGPRFVVVQFENLDKLTGWYNAQETKDARPIGEKYATFRVFAAGDIEAK